MKAVYMFAAMALLLFGLAIFFPYNSLTGKVVKTDDSCGPLGCVQLCEQKTSSNNYSISSQDSNSVCRKDMVCCETHWESGVCDYQFNCEKVRQYSLYQTLETYKDTVKEHPAPVQPGFENFFLPLILIVAVICIVIFKYHNPKQN